MTDLAIHVIMKRGCYNKPTLSNPVWRPNGSVVALFGPALFLSSFEVNLKANLALVVGDVKNTLVSSSPAHISNPGLPHVVLVRGLESHTALANATASCVKAIASRLIT